VSFGPRTSSTTAPSSSIRWHPPRRVSLRCPGHRRCQGHRRGPGRVLRSHKPDTVYQEIYGYLLTHYAISALICRAATEADIDPDRVKFLHTVRILRRNVAAPTEFSP